METFITTILQIKDEINKQKEHPSILIDNIVIQKQYLVYYVYRTICHHFAFFKSLALSKNINDINDALEISHRHQFICYPMANRMTTDETKLDSILDTMLSLFTEAIKKMTELKQPKKDIIENILSKKTHDVIIKDIKKIVKFVPNLSKYQYLT